MKGRGKLGTAGPGPQYSQKWGASGLQDLFQREAQMTQLTPPPFIFNSAMEQWDKRVEHKLGIDPAEGDANKFRLAGAWQESGKRKYEQAYQEEYDLICEKFARDFQNWLLGQHPTDPTDEAYVDDKLADLRIKPRHGKLPGKDVDAYLTSFIEKKSELKRKLMLLRLGPHRAFKWNLGHYWLFYKYILRNIKYVEDDLLTDFDKYWPDEDKPREPEDFRFLGAEHRTHLPPRLPRRQDDKPTQPSQNPQHVQDAPGPSHAVTVPSAGGVSIQQDPPHPMEVDQPVQHVPVRPPDGSSAPYQGQIPPEQVPTLPAVVHGPEPGVVQPPNPPPPPQQPEPLVEHEMSDRVETGPSTPRTPTHPPQFVLTQAQLEQIISKLTPAADRELPPKPPQPEPPVTPEGLQAGASRLKPTRPRRKPKPRPQRPAGTEPSSPVLAPTPPPQAASAPESPRRLLPPPEPMEAETLPERMEEERLPDPERLAMVQSHRRNRSQQLVAARREEKREEAENRSNIVSIHRRRPSAAAAAVIEARKPVQPMQIEAPPSHAQPSSAGAVVEVSNKRGVKRKFEPYEIVGDELVKYAQQASKGKRSHTDAEKVWESVRRTVLGRMTDYIQNQPDWSQAEKNAHKDALLAHWDLPFAKTNLTAEGIKEAANVVAGMEVEATTRENPINPDLYVSMEWSKLPEEDRQLLSTHIISKLAYGKMNLVEMLTFLRFNNSVFDDKKYKTKFMKRLHKVARDFGDQYHVKGGAPRRQPPERKSYRSIGPSTSKSMVKA